MTKGEGRQKTIDSRRKTDDRGRKTDGGEKEIIEFSTGEPSVSNKECRMTNK